ncbi:MAG: hypothetical protein LAP21_07740 [Acidobacteriia bacterium]|nr:hypothetical protein [Terriglobia bacterium]
MIVIIVVVLLVAACGWYSFRHFRRAPAAVAAVPPVQPVPGSPAPAAGAAGKIHTPPFAPLTVPVTPGFLNSVAITPDVKVSFYYEGDERTPTDEIWYLEKKSIQNEQGEDYLLMPSSIDPNKGYGPTEFEIFKNQESHAYQGVPVSILNAGAKYSLQYVGLKINDPRFISQLDVEVGVDYRAEDDGDVLENPATPKASMSPLSAWFSPPVVYACGPGLYLRPIGESKLLTPQAENGVAWYKLEKPVALYNLPLDYCDKPAGQSEAKKKPKARKEDEDEDDAGDFEYCSPIKDFTGGQLRFHVLYKPSGMEGPLQVQAVNFILQDEQGRYFQPTIGANYSRYYKAYLIDRQCFSFGKEPADCLRQ